MPNNTTLTISEAGSLILSRPYLLWFENDVFPYIFGTTSLITILLGIIFNIVILKLFATEEHVGIKRAINQLVAVDIFAEVFVLAPGMYMSYSKLDDLPNTYCIINGMFIVATFLIQSGFLSLGLATSLIALLHHKQESEYHTKGKHICSVICIFVFSIILALIPVTWKDGYVYMTSEYHCGPNRSIKKAYTNVIFSIGLFASLILACTVSAVLIKRLLSRNTQVSELRHTQSEETVTVEDQTGSHGKALELSSDRRNRFKSDETVSMEDHTKSYEMTGGDVSDRSRNRFRSDVTVSMEDHTRSYGNVPFKDSTQSGITVSMEDRTRTNSKKYFNSNTSASIEFVSFRRPTDLTISSFRESSSSNDSLQTVLDASANSITPEAGDNMMVSDKDLFGIGHESPTDLNNVVNTNKRHIGNNEDEISIDDSCGGEVITRAASRSNLSVSPESSVGSTKGSFKTNENAQTGNINILENLLQSTAMDKNITFKLAATNVAVSFAVLACWSPFVIMVYIDMYGSPWWDGWLAMTVLLANISYCILPLVILGIRGQLVQASKAILPKSVENRTNRITSVLTQTIDKVNKRIF